MLRTDDVLYPHRMVWPAFWGEMKDAQDPAAQSRRRSTKRCARRCGCKRNSTFTETLGKVTLKAEDKAAALGEERAKVAAAELTEAEKAKLADLEKAKSRGGVPRETGAPP